MYRKTPVLEYSKDIGRRNITSMIVVGDKLIIADRESSTITVFNEDFDVLSETPFSSFVVGFFWGIADMNVQKAGIFGVLVPGFLQDSECWLYALQRNSTIKYLQTIPLDKRCFGICFQRERFLFGTFSPSFGGPGYVKMIDLEGNNCVQTFEHDKMKKHIFSNSISKIYVDNTFKMFICDANRDVSIFEKDGFDNSVSLLTKHKYSVKSITTMSDGSSFLATNSEDGVVLIHPDGARINYNFLSKDTLSGESVAVVVTNYGQMPRLIVAVEYYSWFRKYCKLVVYHVTQTKDNDTRILIGP